MLPHSFTARGERCWSCRQHLWFRSQSGPKTSQHLKNPPKYLKKKKKCTTSNSDSNWSMKVSSFFFPLCKCSLFPHWDFWMLLYKEIPNLCFWSYYTYWISQVIKYHVPPTISHSVLRTEDQLLLSAIPDDYLHYSLEFKASTLSVSPILLWGLSCAYL